MQAKLFKCTHCGKVQERKVMEQGDDGKLYCEGCWNELFSSCAGCLGVFKKGELKWIDGMPYCSDCLIEYFGRCEKCGEIVSKDDLYEIPGGEIHCKRCFDKVYGECSICGEVDFLQHLHKESGRLYCDKCSEIMNKDSFEVYFDDLDEKCRKRLLYFYGMSDSSERNWDITPLFILEKEDN